MRSKKERDRRAYLQLWVDRAIHAEVDLLTVRTESEDRLQRELGVRDGMVRHIERLEALAASLGASPEQIADTLFDAFKSLDQLPPLPSIDTPPLPPLPPRSVWIRDPSGRICGIVTQQEDGSFEVGFDPGYHPDGVLGGPVPWLSSPEGYGLKIETDATLPPGAILIRYPDGRVMPFSSWLDRVSPVKEEDSPAKK